MSHDRKPGKMRLVGTAGAPTRRREDAGVVAIALVAPDGNAIAPDAAPKSSGRLLTALFVAGCALGGAALPLARTL